MTDDKITEIRARHERIQRDCTLATPPGSMAGQVAAVDAHEDRATLLAEVDRQRAEIERLLQAIGLVTTTVPDMEIDIENPVGMAQRVVAEVDRLRAENERLRNVLRRLSVRPSGDSTVQIAFVSEGCKVTYPVRPQTTWALEVLIEFDKARREALEGNS